MSFDFRAIFSGLCAYVPNRPLRGEKNRVLEPRGLSTAIQVVMVDARNERRAPDRRLMRTHVPILFAPSTEHLVGHQHLTPSSGLIWNLDRLQLRFRVKKGDRQDGFLGEPLGVRLSSPSNRGFTALDDFSWGVSMEEIAPDLGDIDPRCFEAEGSAGLVAARVLLDQGEISTFNLGVDKNWTFVSDKKRPLEGPTTLGGRFNPRFISNKTCVKFESVEEVSIEALSLDLPPDMASENKTKLVFRAPSAKGPERTTVDVNVGNICSWNFTRVVNSPKRDADFRWFYELSERRETIVLPKNCSLPIPERVPGGPVGNGTSICVRSTFNAFPFAF